MILVAEDDVAIRQFLHRALTREGHEVVAARDGQEALALAEHHRPAVVVSDVRMPELDGVALTRALAERYAEERPPVILTSAYEDVDIDGADAFLAKPFDLAELLDRIDQLLGRLR